MNIGRLKFFGSVWVSNFDYDSCDFAYPDIMSDWCFSFQFSIESHSDSISKLIRMKWVCIIMVALKNQTVDFRPSMLHTCSL